MNTTMIDTPAIMAIIAPYIASHMPAGEIQWPKNRLTIVAAAIRSMDDRALRWLLRNATAEDMSLVIEHDAKQSEHISIKDSPTLTMLVTALQKALH